MQKKVAITKNGYDILRIVEGKSNGEKCEFQISPQISPESIRFFAMPLFSNAEYVPYDQTRKLEITYHKATSTKPTKIHLKLTDRNDKSNIISQTLPLKELIDPNVKTEIPIPLFKVIIPDEVLKTEERKEFKPDKKHVAFDVKQNNVIEVFMTRVNFELSTFQEKWPSISKVLLVNCIQYFATGSIKFMGYNIGEALNQCKETKKPSTMIYSANVTDDIGVLLIATKDPDIKTKTMDFLFVENSIYLGLVGGTRIGEKGQNFMPAYEKDLQNDVFFNYKEREKWKYEFQKQIKRLDKKIKQKVK